MISMVLTWMWGCVGGEAPKEDPLVVQPPTDKGVLEIPPLPAPVVAPGEPAPPITSSNCEDEMSPPDLQGPDCITATLQCGQTVIGTTKGGGQWFGSRFYEKKYCTPATIAHDAGHERVYALSLPAGDRHASIFLDTPCADLDMAVMRVLDFTTCPTMDTSISQCDMWPKPGNFREHVEISSQEDTHWLVVVEGKTEQDGPFALTVQCRDGL